jgi:cytochrome c oxidase subunit 3/cytochrome o ubiquinol oxidase subunit 3
MGEAEARATAKRTNLAPLFSKEKLGVWFFLGSEVILFGTLILTYLAFRLSYAEQYAGFRSHLSIPLIGANTFVLILSSYFVVRALQGIKQDKVRAFLLNLLTVVALGSLFIGGQAYEWSKLFSEDITLTNTFGSPFLIVTGIHGTHVLIGLAWAAIVLFFGIDDSYGSRGFSAVEFFGLYWHFVDIVWIILFSLIYLL